MNEWFESDNLTAKTGDITKATIWSVTKELRPGLMLTLRRVKTYTTNKVDDKGEIVREGKDTGYRTELEACGKTLTIAPLELESGAEWLLDQWVKQLDPILQKYEANPAPLTVMTINSPETFIQAITQSVKYKERKHNDR